jgi:GT2 family glycosyltransferase
MTRVDVVIPTWNGRHLLPFCLQALTHQQEVDLEILLVDNGSTDGTAAWLDRCHPRIRRLTLPANQGFAAAVNAGVAASSDEFVLILNNDAAPAPLYVSSLATFLASTPSAAAVQGRILRHVDPTRIDSLGICFDPLLRAFQSGFDEPDPGSGPPVQVFGVTACAALYRRSALAQVADPGTPPAIFDPHFFAYYEDVDLSLRLRGAGWETWLEPATSCEHVGSATGGDGSMGKAFLLGRNYLLYAARHLGGPGLLRLAPGLLGVSLRRLLTWPMHPRRDTALWAGELAALPRLPRALRLGRRSRRHPPPPGAATLPPG